MGLSAKVILQLVARHDNALDLAAAIADLNHTKTFAFANGTGANQADRIFHDNRTLAAAGTENHDLAGGLPDPLTNAAITFGRIRALIVYGDPANTHNVVLGNSGANAWLGPFGAAAHTAHVQPGGQAVFVTPGTTAWPVTAGTGDILTVTNSGGVSLVRYDMILLGASA